MIQKRGITFHCYADDAQLYLSIKPDKTAASQTPACVKEIKDWMTSHFLQLNSDKSTTLSCSTTAGTWGVSSTRTRHFSLKSNRLLGRISFTWVTLPRSGASCLRVMLENGSESLLLLDWTSSESNQQKGPDLSGFSYSLAPSVHNGFSFYAGSCSRFLPVKSSISCHCADLGAPTDCFTVRGAKEIS